MDYSDEMNANKKIARIAGLWYLILAITSGFSWMYITKTFIAGDAVLTAKNIITTESQYLISIISNIVGQISFIFLVLALHRLLRKVNEFQARLMLTFVLVSVPIMFINIIFQTGAFVILGRADYLKLFTKDQTAALATMFIHLNIMGVHVVEIFWGLWLFPLGYLVYRSNFIPKIIAFLILISGGGYLVGSLTSLVFPGIYTLIEKYLSIPESLGELVMLFWLLIKGVSMAEKNINY
jgi:hypothetical protein